jgi:dihydrodipicolinate synthase/N-acetylneuraminate lyase
MLLEGIFLPLTTPFHPDGRLYLSKLAANVERYSRTPAAGMLVLGRTGEADGLTDAERREVLTAAIGAAASEKVMIANVGRASVRATLELAEVAAKAGYDAVAVEAPEFAGAAAMRLELLTYFRAVADQSALPVVLLSERERSLPVEAIAELAEHPGIIGVVDARSLATRVAELLTATAVVSREVTVTATFAAVTGRMSREMQAAGSFVSAESLGGGGAAVAAPVRRSLKTRTKRVGFQVLGASTSGMLEAWNAGAAGAVPRLGACAPQACCEVWQAFRDGDPALAAEKQDRVLRIGDLVEGWAGIAALKYGCDLNGYFGGRARLPLLGLTEAQRAMVERELGGLRN